MKPYRLFISARSPFARRIRLALQRLQVEVEVESLNVFEPPAALFAANPLGLVPVLEILGASQGFPRFIMDSGILLEYLHEVHGQKIWPVDLVERTQVRTASTLAEGVMSNTVAHFLETQRSHPDATWFADYSGALTRTLALIQVQDLSVMPWVDASHELTQAGWDLLNAWNYLELRTPVEDAASKYPQLKAFFDKYENLPEMAATAPPPA
ncbi:MAG: glutathione S-transferase [Methylotenera sp.]|nr:glutathione S-transferase [Oligoflexia bacterium]